MSKYTDEILGHADEADGIEEYDNPLPDWWLGLFWVCNIIGVIYAVDYHFYSQHSQAKFYEAEMVAALEQWPELNQAAAFDDSPETLALGKEVFDSTCASCHNQNLTGGIGPNLVDTEWIHGGRFEDLVHTITEGVAAKGMPQWGPVLGPKKISAAASYILSKNTGEAPAAPAEAAPAEAAPAEGADDALADADPLVKGEQVFKTNCVACHKEDMTGGIGPNLIDDEWIHGGELEQITATITNGVPAKGMITWKGVLPDDQIAAVAAFVYAKSHPTE